MDSKVLKRFIKQAVKEAIQEELKDILVEAVKAPKVPIGIGGYGVPNTLTETYTPTTSAPPLPMNFSNSFNADSSDLGSTGLMCRYSRSLVADF